MSQSFQTQVTIAPAPGEEGDFYGTNPRAIAIAGPGQFVSPNTPSPIDAGQNGLVVGHFAWCDTDNGVVSQSYVPGYQLAFLRRGNNAIITQFLGQATMLIPQGLPITLYSQGDFWAKFAAGATPGQLVAADPDTGAPIAYDSGSLPNTVSMTGSVGAAVTALVGASAATGTNTGASVAITGLTGYLSPGDVLTDGTNSATILSQASGTTGSNGTYNLVAAPTPGDWVAASLTGTSNNIDVTVDAGLISVGDTITGSGFTAAKITAQISGTAGGTGVYSFAGAQQGPLTSRSFTINSNILNVTAISSGVPGVGDVLTGPSGSPQITGQLTGSTGSTGTYSINGSAIHFASGTITVAAITTPWIVNGSAGNGELAPISTWG